MKKEALSTALLAALAPVLACGGAGRSDAFAPGWRDDRGRSIAALEERLRSAPRPALPAVAVGVEEAGLVGAVLPTGGAWRYRGRIDSAPIVAGSVVVARSGKELVALDAAGGRVLWRANARGNELRGAADDGVFTVLTLGKAGKSASLVLAVDRSGKTTLELETEFELGRPAALDGVAFVPWSGQYVSAIDIASGDELGRLLMRDLVTHALDVGGSLWFGEKALVRFDSKIGFAVSSQATRFGFQPRELPGKPAWLGSGAELATLDRSARARIRLVALPVARADGIALASGSYAASYFRVVYGLAEKDGRLVWADALPGDALAAAAALSGFVFCDATGKVQLYDALGGASGVVELGARLVGCSVGANSLEIAPGKPRGSLAEQIGRAFEHIDSDMAAAEDFLIAELGKLEDPVATRVLIALAQNERLPPAQREQARRSIGKRRNGVEHMLAALGRHYDFISGDQPPPLAPLADALGALGEKRAAPLLARHLNDPANGIDDVAHAALALEALATRAELDELRTFFALYRATADDDLLVKAVVSVASALLRVGGAEGRELVGRAVSDPLTQPDVQRGLTELLAAKSATGEKTVDSAAP